VRQSLVWEDVPITNLGRAQRGQCLPGHPRRQFRGRTHRKGLAARHRDDRVELRFKIVAAFEEPTLGRHDLRLIGDARPVKVVKRHPRPRRAEEVAVEIETVHLSAIGLVGQSLRRRHRFARVEDVGEIVGRFLLFRPLRWSFLGGLRLCDSVWRRLVSGRLRSRAFGDGKAENTQDETSNRKGYF
jgi:hypothetical protein